MCACVMYLNKPVIKSVACDFQNHGHCGFKITPFGNMFGH